MKDHENLCFIISNYNNNHKNKIKKFSLNSNEHEMISLSTNYSQSFKNEKMLKSNINLNNSNNINKNTTKNKISEIKKVEMPSIFHDRESKLLTRTYSEPKFSISEYWDENDNLQQPKNDIENISKVEITSIKASEEKDNILLGTDKSKYLKSTKLGNSNVKKHVSPENDSEILDSPYNNIFFFEFSKALKFYLENYIKERLSNTDISNEDNRKIKV